MIDLHRLPQTTLDAMEIDLRKIVPVEAAYTIGDQARLSVPDSGAASVLNFTVERPMAALFDLIDTNENRANLRFTLDGPAGRVFTNSALNSLTQNQIFDLEPGAYRLTALGTDDETGATALRVVDLTHGPLTPFNIPQSGTRTPGGQALMFAFEAELGERVLLDLAQFDGSDTFTPFWRVLDSSGTIVGSFDGTAEVNSFDVQRSGRHVLIIDPRVDQRADVSYEFTFRTTPKTQAPLVLGDKVEADLATPYAVHEYLFTLTDTKALFLDSIADPPISLTLYDADGNEISTGASTDLGTRDLYNRFFNLPSGSYRLQVTASGASTAPYSFTLRGLAAEAVALPLDTITTASSSDGARIYQLDAAPGDQLYFENLSYEGDAQWAVVNDGGGFVAGNLSRTDLVVDIWDPGAHFLIVDHARDNPGDFTAEFRVTRPSQTVQSYVPGTAATATIGRPQDIQSFAFTLSETGRYYADMLSVQSGTEWALYRNGQELRGWTRFDQSTPNKTLFDLDSAEYEIKVRGTGAFTGEVSFNLLPLTDATLLEDNVASPLTTLDPALGAALFAWDGTAGETLRLAPVTR